MEKNRDELIDELFVALCKDSEIKLAENFSTHDKRWMIDQLLLLHGDKFEDEIIDMQDALLKIEKSEIIDAKNLKYKHHHCVFPSLNKLRADMLITFSNTLFVDPKSLKDYEIFLNSGIQIFNEYYDDFKTNNIIHYSEPYITKAYNLDFEEISKIVLSSTNTADKLFSALILCFQHSKEQKFHFIAIDTKNLYKHLNNEGLSLNQINDIFILIRKAIKSTRLKCNFITNFDFYLKK